ncbi:hypothetical protein COBT_001977 [Conglomerata obtusa]
MQEHKRNIKFGVLNDKRLFCNLKWPNFFGAGEILNFELMNNRDCKLIFEKILTRRFFGGLFRVERYFEDSKNDYTVVDNGWKAVLEKRFWKFTIGCDKKVYNKNFITGEENKNGNKTKELYMKNKDNRLEESSIRNEKVNNSSDIRKYNENVVYLQVEKEFGKNFYFNEIENENNERIMHKFDKIEKINNENQKNNLNCKFLLYKSLFVNALHDFVSKCKTESKINFFVRSKNLLQKNLIYKEICCTELHYCDCIGFDFLTEDNKHKEKLFNGQLETPKKSNNCYTTDYILEKLDDFININTNFMNKAKSNINCFAKYLSKNLLEKVKPNKENTHLDKKYNLQVMQSESKFGSLKLILKSGFYNKSQISYPFSKLTLHYQMKKYRHIRFLDTIFYFDNQTISNTLFGKIHKSENLCIGSSINGFKGNSISHAGGNKSTLISKFNIGAIYKRIDFFVFYNAGFGSIQNNITETFREFILCNVLQPRIKNLGISVGAGIKLPVVNGKYIRFLYNIPISAYDTFEKYQIGFEF